jgi:hypothetical protein
LLVVVVAESQKFLALIAIPTGASAKSRNTGKKTGRKTIRITLLDTK